MDRPGNRPHGLAAQFLAHLALSVVIGRRCGGHQFAVGHAARHAGHAQLRRLDARRCLQPRLEHAVRWLDAKVFVDPQPAPHALRRGLVRQQRRRPGAVRQPGSGEPAIPVRGEFAPAARRCHELGQREERLGRDGLVGLAGGARCRGAERLCRPGRPGQHGGCALAADRFPLELCPAGVGLPQARCRFARRAGCFGPGAAAGAAWRDQRRFCASQPAGHTFARRHLARRRLVRCSPAARRHRTPGRPECTACGSGVARCSGGRRCSGWLLPVALPHAADAAGSAGRRTVVCIDQRFEQHPVRPGLGQWPLPARCVARCRPAGGGFAHS